MAVKIRMTRIGTTKRPYYRIIATDSRKTGNGRNLEILGTYDPKNISLPKDSSERPEKGRVILKTDRIQYWLGVGAEASPTVKSVLKRANAWPK